MLGYCICYVSRQCGFTAPRDASNNYGSIHKNFLVCLFPQTQTRQRDTEAIKEMIRLVNALSISALDPCVPEELYCSAVLVANR